MSLPLSCSGLIVHSLFFAMILPQFPCQIMPCSQDDQEKTVVVEEGGTASLTLCLKSQPPYEIFYDVEVKPNVYSTRSNKYLLRGQEMGKITVDWSPDECSYDIPGCVTVHINFKDLEKSDLNQTVTLTFLKQRKGTNKQPEVVYDHPVDVRLHLQDRKVMPCSQDDQEKTVVVEEGGTASLTLCLKSLGPFDLSERVGVEPVSYAIPGKTYLLKGPGENAEMRVNWSKSKCPDKTPHCVNVLVGFKNLVKTDQNQTVTLTFYEKRGGKIVYENPVHVRLHLQEGKVIEETTEKSGRETSDKTRFPTTVSSQSSKQTPSQSTETAEENPAKSQSSKQTPSQSTETAEENPVESTGIRTTEKGVKEASTETPDIILIITPAIVSVVVVIAFSTLILWIFRRRGGNAQCNNAGAAQDVEGRQSTGEDRSPGQEPSPDERAAAAANEASGRYISEEGLVYATMGHLPTSKDKKTAEKKAETKSQGNCDMEREEEDDRHERVEYTTVKAQKRDTD